MVMVEPTVRREPPKRKSLLTMMVSFAILESVPEHDYEVIITSVGAGDGESPSFVDCTKELSHSGRRRGRKRDRLGGAVGIRKPGDSAGSGQSRNYEDTAYLDGIGGVFAQCDRSGLADDRNFTSRRDHVTFLS